MSFAALQSRVNTTALRRLGEDVLLDGVSVRADFAEPYAQGYMEGVSAPSVSAEARAPQITLASSNVPASVNGKAVVARSTNYTVVGHKPDGFGLSTLVLELA